MRAPSSAVIVVPTTPATTVAVTNVPNSRTIATTMNPPARSIVPNVARKLPACRPGPEKPHAAIERAIGMNVTFRMKMHCSTNSRRQTNGGRTSAAVARTANAAMPPMRPMRVSALPG